MRISPKSWSRDVPAFSLALAVTLFETGLFLGSEVASNAPNLRSGFAHIGHRLRRSGLVANEGQLHFDFE
jgi:hypothetical protein